MTHVPYTLRIDLDAVLQAGYPVVLELGCGQTKQPGRIGIDRLELPGVDIVANIDDGFPYLPDHSVDEIHSRSLLEHVSDLELVLRETLRVLKKGGKCYAFVPHFSNPYYYSDYTHNRFFGLYTFYYFVRRDNQLRRKVPTFYTGIRLKILSQKIVFTSPFAGIRLYKRLLQAIFNSSSRLQEFYEENLCYVFPCYGLDVVFTNDDSVG